MDYKYKSIEERLAAKGAGNMYNGMYYGNEAGGDSDIERDTNYPSDGNVANYDFNKISGDTLGFSGKGDFDYKPTSTGWSGGEIMDGVLGLGNLGLGYMSYTQNKKNAKSQRKLANQQYYDNARIIQNEEADRAHLKKIFNT